MWPPELNIFRNWPFAGKVCYPVIRGSRKSNKQMNEMSTLATSDEGASAKAFLRR